MKKHIKDIQIYSHLSYSYLINSLNKYIDDGYELLSLTTDYDNVAKQNIFKSIFIKYIN